MKYFLKFLTIITFALMIGVTHPLRDVTFQQVEALKKDLANTTKIIKDLDAEISKAKSTGGEPSKISITADKKKYDLTAQSLLSLRNNLAKILKDIAAIDPVQKKSLEEGVQEDLKKINSWTSNGYIATTAVVIGEDRGANKFKTIEYKADGISDNRNSLLQLKDWFASKVGTIEYDNAIDTTSGLLDGQVKVLEKMLNGINITYPGTTNTTDKLVIVTADQLNNVFKTIDAAIDDLDKIKTADGKAATEIDAIKKQIENVKNKRISYLQDIILKIANDSAETQALGMYLKVKRLDYWTVKSMLHQSLADYEKLTPLDEGVNGSLLNVAKKQQMLGDHMPHYKMLEQESSYFVDTIDVLSGIATTFKEYFEKHNALFNRSKIENALVTNLFSKTHKKLLDQAETYLSMLGSVDNKLGPQALNNKDTGIDNLTNREFYNKHLVGPLKSIALAMKKWTSIENNLLSIFFITIDGLNDIVKEANSSVSSFFANK